MHQGHGSRERRRVGQLHVRERRLRGHDGPTEAKLRRAGRAVAKGKLERLAVNQ